MDILLFSTLKNQKRDQRIFLLIALAASVLSLLWLEVPLLHDPQDLNIILHQLSYSLCLPSGSIPILPPYHSQCLLRSCEVECAVSAWSFSFLMTYDVTEDIMSIYLSGPQFFVCLGLCWTTQNRFLSLRVLDIPKRCTIHGIVLSRSCGISTT